jgi:FlaA1/EpsC-like NDP-sugar epimerase
MRKLRSFTTVAILLVWDTAAVIAAVVLGFKLYYGFGYELKPEYINERLVYIPLCIFIVVICNAIMGCYLNVWRHASIGEFLKQITAVILATVILLLINIQNQLGIHYEMIIIIGLLLLLFMITIRASVTFASWINTRIVLIKNHNSMKKVLIYGAGEAGINLVHKLDGNKEENRHAVAFIDDNKAIWGRKIFGLTVLGGSDKISYAVKNYGIEEVIVAIPTADREMLKNVLDLCHKLHCSVKRFGTIDEISEESLNKAKISDVNLEDLLRRNPVKLDMKAVKEFIEDKVVLVTGGAGSIGSEICRQVLNFGAKQLIIFDFCENGLYEINNELQVKFDTQRYKLVLGSIRDSGRLNDVFKQYHPQVVFHAAAHKHVPMMELNPMEAIKNNVFGTINLAKAAIAHNVEKFISISTDKAVNPMNIMGASKRIVELVIQSLDKSSSTEFAAVRFGNVLGSSGSVVPFFKKQIEAGGPVTVVHPEMRRYFMTIPEAVQLVLEAGAMANGGEIFVLDMGEPVLIYDLACDLIKLSGFEPNKDIKIEFTSLRPGEKLFEEISLADEDVTKTRNNKIFICKPIGIEKKRLSDILDQMRTKIGDDKKSDVFELVKELVPTYKNEGKIDSTIHVKTPVLVEKVS